MCAAKRTTKQKEFDLLLAYGNDSTELTKRIDCKDLELVDHLKDKISWAIIARRTNLTEEFINRFYDYLKPHIDKIQVNVNIHTDFLIREREYINWSNFLYKNSCKRITVEFIKEFYNELKPYFSYILSKKELPKKSREYIEMDMVGDSNNFKNLSANKNISIDIIDMYGDKLNWDKLSNLAICLCVPKNFNKYFDKINLNEFTSLNYNNTLYSRLKIIYDKDFLLHARNTEYNWEAIITSSYKVYDYIKTKNISLLSFFKDNLQELPKEAKEAYEKYKLKQKYYNMKWE